jgi:hypothetical protein
LTNTVSGGPLRSAEGDGADSVREANAASSLERFTALARLYAPWEMNRPSSVQYWPLLGNSVGYLPHISRKYCTLLKQFSP